MHSVIKRILQRRSKRAPFSDKRKIALVLFGGLMTGVRSTGALLALKELGLSNAFDAIYSISCGLPNALYFLSGQGNIGASIYYDDLSGRKFINFLKPWKIVNIDYMISIMKTKKPLSIAEIIKSKTKLYTRLMDMQRKKVFYLEVHKIPSNEHFGLIRAATSLSFFHPGKTKIGNSHYKDPDFRNEVLREHIDKAVAAKATDILVIYNNLGQYASVHKNNDPLPFHIFEIYPKPEWRMRRFETRSDVLKNAALQMGRLTKQAFGFSESIRL